MSSSLPEETTRDLIELVSHGSPETIKERLAEIEGPIAREVLVAAEKTGDPEKVTAVMWHITLHGDEGLGESSNWLLWALRYGFLIAAGQAAENAFPETLLEKNAEGKTALEIAREIGAEGVVEDILACAEFYGINLEKPPESE